MAVECHVEVPASCLALTVLAALAPHVVSLGVGDSAAQLRSLAFGRAERVGLVARSTLGHTWSVQHGISGAGVFQRITSE